VTCLRLFPTVTPSMGRRRRVRARTVPGVNEEQWPGARATSPGTSGEGDTRPPGARWRSPTAAHTCQPPALPVTMRGPGSPPGPSTRVALRRASPARRQPADALPTWPSLRRRSHRSTTDRAMSGQSVRHRSMQTPGARVRPCTSFTTVRVGTYSPISSTVARSQGVSVVSARDPHRRSTIRRLATCRSVSSRQR